MEVLQLKQLKKNKCLQEYVLAVLIFIIVTFKFMLVDQQFGLVEVAFVHYGIGLLVYMFLHYLFFVNKSILVKHWKKVIFVCSSVLISSILSILLSVVVITDENGWELFHQCAFFMCAFLCVETMIIFIAKRIDFEVFASILLFLVVTTLSICLPIRNGISWDDQIHYERAVCVSNIFDTTINGGDEVLILAGVNRTLYEDLTYNEYIDEVNQSYIVERKSDIYAMSWDSKRYFVAYLPAAFGLLLGRGLGLPYAATFVLGRLMNAWLYAFFVFKSMKQLKSGKLVLTIFAFYPTNIFLAANYSYDYWIIALMMYSISYFLGIMQEKQRKMQLKDMVIIFGTMLLGLIPKATYFPMLMFFVLISNKTKFENNRIKNIYYILLIVSIIIAVCWFVVPYLVSGAGGNDMRGGTNVNSNSQLVYIFSQPVQYAKTLIGFLEEYWSLNSIKSYMSFWAYMGFTFFHEIYLICVILTIFIDRKECDNEMAGVTKTFIWGIIAFGISAINATALYIAFTPVGANSIAGCQPRYLLPLLFPTMYLIGSNWISRLLAFFRNNIVYGIIAAFGAFVNLYSVWNISIVTWIG